MKPVLSYVLILILSLLFCFGINILCGFSVISSFLYIFIGALFIFIFDAIIAFLLHLIPQKSINYNAKFFNVNKNERKFYEKIGIRKWKDKIPEMGQLCHFKKDKISSNELKYVDKFLVETCYAEIVHYGMIAVGLFIIIIIPFEYVLNYSLPLVLINTFLNLPPILIQRYNRPKLLLLRQRILKQKSEKDV